MSRKYNLFFISVIILSLAGYLLLPLSSNEFEIKWDQSMIEAKRNFLLYQPVQQNQTKRPNIILILVDDLGKTDITLYGEGKVNTPHIDELGAEGVVFDQAYVTSSVCSPSRAAIMTGRYPQRFGFTYQMHEFYLANRLQYFGYKYLIDSDPWLPRGLEPVPNEEMARKQGLPPSEITLPELLKKEGYTTALIGKWHLGVHENNKPCNFGFDYQYGFYASHSLYDDEDDPDIVNVKIKEDFSDAYIWKGQRDGPHAIYRNCNEIEEKEYLTNAITRECKDFIKSNIDTSFFLIASYNAPHTPLQATKTYVNKFSHISDPVKRVYYAMIANLDDAIGELTAYLKELDIDDETIIFFISDNGGADYTHTTDNYPLKGGKITDFEGGLNVPLIMKWGKRLPPGLHYKDPVSSMDIFGTLTSVLDIDLPQDRIYDGVSLLPYVLNEKSESLPHDYLYWYRGNTRAIRSKEWKMVWNEEFNEKSLFYLGKDNLEQNNVFSTNPQIAENLDKSYNKWVRDMIKPLWPPLVYFVYEDSGVVYHFDN
jgi:arylsulfatase A-like enzyme